MLLTISLIILIIVISAGMAQTDKNWKSKGTRHRVFFGWVGALTAISIFFVSTIVTDSYMSYLGSRSFYDATVEQYASAVNIYKDKAIIDIEVAAMTDLRYSGYQENISKFIMSLRDRIIQYNETYVKKNRLKKNIFFGWFISNVDEDMKIISMSKTFKGSNGRINMSGGKGV